MQILIILGIIIILILFVYTIFKMSDITTRLTIIDTRLRIIEPLLSNPDINDENYHEIRQALYNEFFSNLYIGKYYKIVKLAQKDTDLGLSWLEQIPKVKNLDKKN